MVGSVAVAGAFVPTKVGSSVSPPNLDQVASVSDGPDKENDGDSDDVGIATATRGNRLNITA